MQGLKLTPQVVWAQKRNQIYVTIKLRDIAGEDVQINEDKVQFKGTSNGKSYEFSFLPYKAVNPQKSKTSKTGANLLIILTQKQSTERWPRLTKDNMKSTFIGKDWDRWEQDSDEEAQQQQKDDGKKYEGYKQLNDDQDDDDLNDKEKNQNFGNGMDDFIEYDEKYEEKANNSD